ncbi:MAG: hypothetical protein M2R45_00641 [Verrucomicrobia subdivision 3 bacterium]|nr:hypothetical protein [Limisphaerales bacterium]MCS1414476.1 hypothetical protein [Limisphaerales bacterium]
MTPVSVKTYFQHLFPEKISHPEGLLPAEPARAKRARNPRTPQRRIPRQRDRQPLSIHNLDGPQLSQAHYTKLGIHNRTEAVIQYLQK